MIAGGVGVAFAEIKMSYATNTTTSTTNRRRYHREHRDECNNEHYFGTLNDHTAATATVLQKGHAGD